MSTLLDSGMDVYFPREVTESEEAAISEETALIAEMRLGMNMGPIRPSLRQTAGPRS
jgi:hypothetical protein